MIFVLQGVSRLFLLIACLIVASCLSAVIIAAEATAVQPKVEHYGLLPKYRSVSISPDGKHIALIEREGTQDFFVVRNTETLEMVGGFNADKYNARGVFFASDNHVIILNSKHRRMARIRGPFEQAYAFVYNLTSQKIKVLLAQSKGLYPAQNLTNIVGLNPTTNELYMTAYTGNLYNTPRLDLYRVSLKNGMGKVYAKGKRDTVDWFVVIRERY